ncbi:ABC transporter ATP-binding protein [Streptacidiphilus anmyonensis]|uniref:ABC transporter ATP-binding protein n=1 Tax=Streptacidiphilus anmyonensis TaxID=405782 RepID=UPI00069481B5|nr:ABC transporter ATP-binding protein [Streptacidiphilus anmyonensis]
MGPTTLERPTEAGGAAEGTADGAAGEAAGGARGEGRLRALLRFWPLTRGDRRWLALVSVSVVATGLAETVAVLLFGHLTDSALQTGSLHAYWGPAGVWLAVSIVAALVGFGGNCLGAWVGERFILRLRAHVFAHLQRLPAHFFQRHRAGDLVERLTGDVTAVEELAVTGAIGIASALINVVLFGAALAWLRWDMALAVLAASPVFWLAARRMTDRVDAAAHAQRAADGAVSAVIEESLRGVTLRRMFGRAGEEERRLDVEAGRWLRATMSAVRLEECYHQVVVVLESVCVLGVIGLGTWEVGHHRMTVGQLLSFAAFLGCLYPPLQSLGRTTLLVTSAAAAAERVAEIWDAPAVEDTPAAETLVEEVLAEEVLVEDLPAHTAAVSGAASAAWSGAALGATSGAASTGSTTGLVPALEFRGVTLCFPGAADPLLSGVTFGLDAGRTLVVSGPSGAGKSTLARLALRLVEPTRGQVLLDGRPLDRLPLERLRDHLTLVPQHTELLPASATAADNIAVARPGATRAEVVDAAREAGLHDALTRLPQGYDTVLDPQQPPLSTGELRRLALARACLRDSSVWIVDEPTCGLDPEAAAATLAALRRRAAHCAMLVISHDPELCPWADSRLILREGRLSGPTPSAGVGSPCEDHGEVVPRGR